MSENSDFNINQLRVAVVGLGLMGGSLALALKGKCADLLAVEPQQRIRELALKQKIVSRIDENPANILSEADIIILAAPVPAIIKLIPRLPEYAPQPCIVLDLGSTKSVIVEMMSNLPKKYEVLGGHPVCGKERLSLENAEAGLYHSAPFVLTPLLRTTLRARECALQIVQAIGAKPIWMDAATHDKYIAATSHLPYVLASILAQTTPDEAQQLFGPGFRSMSRLASTPTSMMLGVLQTNRENIIESIIRYREKLNYFTEALQSEKFSEIEKFLDQARLKNLK